MTLFYNKALALFTKTQESQIKKGLEKYPEPFNPHSWTPEELLNHALEETVDLTHYLVGLKELLDAKEETINEYKLRLEQKYELEKRRNVLIGDYIRRIKELEGFPTDKPLPNGYLDSIRIKYSDQDDQY